MEDVKEKPQKPSPWTWTHTWSCGKHIHITTGTKSLLIGGLLLGALLALVLCHTDQFLTKDVSSGTLLFGLCLAAAVIISLIATIRIDLPPIVSAIGNTVIVLLLPIVAMTMVECLNGIFTWDWSPNTLMLNYILYMLFYGTVYVFSGSYRLPMLIMNTVFFLLGLTNFYVRAFRGTPFVPMDLFSVGTAANVADAYDFSFNHQVVIALVLLAFLTVVAARLRTPRLPLIVKIASRAFFAALTISIVCIYLFTDMYAQAGLAPDFWSQRRGYNRTGVVMNFCLNIKYISVEKPAGYDADDIENIVLDGADDQDGDYTTPNVICIMNESLSDLSVLGDFETNIPYMPYLNSLSENTVRGNLYVPVIGSGTSNTEFEFLTGAPTSFFPAGSNAYMLYVKNAMPSLVSTLSTQAYTTRAFHPYYQSGWNRRSVYENFGFDRFSSLGSVIKSAILNAYSQSGYDKTLFQQLVEEAYPGENILLRQYVSDSYNYKKVITMYENRDKDKPFFLFNVTMQSHGGYSTKFDNFTEDVYVTAINGKKVSASNYPRLNQYLSLVKASDEAFAELIDYFSTQDEPTVICLFGDHQPNVENRFVDKLLGGDSLTLSTEQLQKQYITPFYIWANYDIEEKEIDRLGANYLSSYVLDVADIEMPAYNQYLLNLSETLPVLNTVGVIDADGNHYAVGDDTPYDELIADYKRVVYNLVFDTENRCDAVFYP